MSSSHGRGTDLTFCLYREMPIQFCSVNGIVLHLWSLILAVDNGRKKVLCSGRHVLGSGPSPSIPSAGQAYPLALGLGGFIYKNIVSAVDSRGTPSMGGMGRDTSRMSRFELSSSGLQHFAFAVVVAYETAQPQRDAISLASWRNRMRWPWAQAGQLSEN